MKLSVSPLHSYIHTHLHSFLCVSHQLHSRFYYYNRCSVLIVIPTVLSHPKTQRVQL